MQILGSWPEYLLRYMQYTERKAVVSGILQDAIKTQSEEQTLTVSERKIHHRTQHLARNIGVHRCRKWQISWLSNNEVNVKLNIVLH